MNEVNGAYLAGLFDGEGSVVLSRGGSITVSVTSTDEDIIDRFFAVVERGGKCGPFFPKNPKHKPYWRWRLWGWDNVEWFYNLIRPWLCQRRVKKFEDLLGKRPEPLPTSASCGLTSIGSNSVTGWIRHWKLKEPPCKECRAAHALAQRQYKERKLKGQTGSQMGLRGPRGEKNGRSKLRAEQVIEIRERRAQGETIASLARVFEVDYKTAWQIVHHEIWQHV